MSLQKPSSVTKHIVKNVLKVFCVESKYDLRYAYCCVPGIILHIPIGDILFIIYICIRKGNVKLYINALVAIGKMIQFSLTFGVYRQSR